jgi:hypothetical protein
MADMGAPEQPFQEESMIFAVQRRDCKLTPEHESVLVSEVITIRIMIMIIIVIICLSTMYKMWTGITARRISSRKNTVNYQQSNKIVTLEVVNSTDRSE